MSDVTKQQQQKENIQILNHSKKQLLRFSAIFIRKTMVGQMKIIAFSQFVAISFFFCYKEKQIP